MGLNWMAYGMHVTVHHVVSMSRMHRRSTCLVTDGVLGRHVALSALDWCGRQTYLDEYTAVEALPASHGCTLSGLSGDLLPQRRPPVLAT